jgi:hypothetical protein
VQDSHLHIEQDVTVPLTAKSGLNGPPTLRSSISEI